MSYVIFSDSEPPPPLCENSSILDNHPKFLILRCLAKQSSLQKIIYQKQVWPEAKFVRLIDGRLFPGENAS